jgi:uncharacterized protein (TIGR02001 family)
MNNFTGRALNVALTRHIAAVLIAAPCLLAAGTSFAADSETPEFSGNVALTTDYRFRGISQGDRSPAIQGGFDVDLGNGFSAGTWASNVTFSGAAIEIDYYAGYGGSINDDIDYSVGFIWYNYPEDDSDPDLDYIEISGSLSMMGGTVGVAISPDYFAETGDFIYLYGDYGIPLGENFNLDLHLGWNLFDSDEDFGAFIGPGGGEDPGKDYIDYSVGVSTSYVGLDFSAAFIGTDLSKGECFAGTKLCDDTIVLSVSKSL